MRILLAAHHFPPRYRGGTEQNVYGLAHNLVALGHEVRVVCVESLLDEDNLEVAERDEAYDGLAVSRLAVSLPPPPARFSATYAHEGIGAWLERHLRRERPDVVHLHSGYLLTAAVVEAAARVGVPAVVTLHDYWFLCPRTTLLRPGVGPCAVPERAAECAWCMALDKRRFRLTLGAFATVTWSSGAALAESGRWARSLGIAPDAAAVEERRVVLRAALERAAAVLVPTRFLRDQFVAAGFPAARFEHVSLGVDNSLAAGARRPAAGVVRLSYIGQIVPHKGVHDLLAAWAGLGARRAAMRLTLHGGLESAPDYVRQLRAQAAGDETIHFAGPFDRRRLGAVLAASDAVVVPSVWYENSSQAVMEALAAGVPVIVSRIGALPELVEPEVDGLLFAPRDPADLALTLRRLVDEPELLERLRGRLRRPRGGAEEARDVAAIYARVATRGEREAKHDG